MRPGLVAIGSGLLVLGALVVASAFATPSPADHASDQRSAVTLAPGSRVALYLWAENGTTSAFSVNWASTAPVTGGLRTASGCGPDPAACVGGPSIENWNATRSGGWSSLVSGGRWLLSLQADGPGSATINLTVAASSTGSTTPPAWAMYVQLASATALGAAGATALFLGLFLRGGVYPRPGAGGPPAPPTPPAH